MAAAGDAGSWPGGQLYTGGSGSGLGSFESLVAGIGSAERQDLLQKLRRFGGEMPRPMTTAKGEVRGGDTILKKLKGESIIYRLLLWVRCVFTQQKKEVLYNRDLLNALARTVDSQHPLIISNQRHLLLSAFWDKLKAIKDCADFFKPYVANLTDRRGEFYVFMSAIVAPDVSDAIMQEADPYTLPLERTVSSDTKSGLLHKLNDTLSSMSDVSKQQMRASVLCVEWLKAFTQLHLDHFLSLFAQSGSNASCLFGYAKEDYAKMARVLAAATTVSDKVLDALFLFSQNTAAGASEDDSTERELQAFTFKAAAKLSAVQMFVSGVPIVSVGRIMMGNYDWNPEVFGGGEDWQQVFRNRWREVFDQRWNSWLLDKRRKEVENMLGDLFTTDQFPILKNRPWANLRSTYFGPEMTAGFIVWYYENEWPLIASALKTLMMEGMFVIAANQSEFSVAVNEITDIMRRVGEFAASLAPGGQISNELSALASDRKNTINWQSKLSTVMLKTETTVCDIRTQFCNQCRVVERVFHGIFDDDVLVGYDTIRNLSTIRGGDNKEFRKTLEQARKSLSSARQILSEVEPLDTPPGSKDKELITPE